VLAGEAQPRPARGQHDHVGTRGQQVDDEWSGLDHLFDVVEDEEEAPVAQHRRDPLG
jgi:hypothetical protein